MNEFDLERYRTAWKDGTRFGSRPLGPDEIEAVLSKQSGDITRQFRVGLVMDMVLKGVAAAAIGGLLLLFRGNPVVTGLNTAVLTVTLLLLFTQWKTLQAIPRPGLAGDSLRG